MRYQWSPFVSSCHNSCAAAAEIIDWSRIYRCLRNGRRPAGLTADDGTLLFPRTYPCIHSVQRLPQDKIPAGRLRSRPCLMGRIGSGVRVSGSFQVFALRMLLHSAGVTSGVINGEGYIHGLSPRFSDRR